MSNDTTSNTLIYLSTEQEASRVPSEFDDILTIGPRCARYVFTYSIP